MMTLEEVKNILESSEANAYEIKDTKKISSELFFVLKKLEINRATKTEALKAKVYVDVDDQRGSSVIVVTSADTKETLEKKAALAISKAKIALNPYFPLAKNQEKVHVTVKDTSLNETALKVAEAIMKADHYDKGWINSTEIFVSKSCISFVNSEGVEQYAEKLSVEFEIIPTWSNEKEEYELYLYYQNNELDEDAITKQVENILALSKNRSEAKNIAELELPKDIPVVMYGEMNELIAYKVFREETSYKALVTHSTHYQKGDAISNTKFDITLKATILGVYHGKNFDSNGVTLTEKEIVKDGVLVDNHGDIQFGYYAKADNATGDYTAMEIKAKGIDFENKPYLKIDYFSAPQYEMSGYFGGEVRLATYFDGTNCIPVTGFSVSGNIYEALKEVEFSKEESTTSFYKGPKYFVFKNVKIS